eukprot:976645-Pyramimonas_sp.AAC.1
MAPVVKVSFGMQRNKFKCFTSAPIGSQTTKRKGGKDTRQNSLMSTPSMKHSREREGEIQI